MAIIPKVDGKRVYKNYKKASDGPWDVIIIGSGIGGMSCASALAQHGRRVLLLERHYIPGGFTHMFSREGFDWDVGVHAMGEMRPSDLPARILDWLSGGHVEMLSLGDPYDRFRFHDGDEVGLPDNASDYIAMLKARFPDQTDRIDRYIRKVKWAALYSRAFFLFKSLPLWMERIGNRFVHLFSDNYWARTTGEVFDELGIEGKLRTVLSLHWGYYGSTPSESSFTIHALTHVHFWGGGFYPAKGARVFAEGMLNKVQQAGGEVLCKAEVSELLMEGGKAVGVRLSDGTTFHAPIVISAAGAKTTVGKLVPEEYRHTEWGRSILDVPDSPSYICLNLGFEGDIESGGGAPANLWLFNTWDSEKQLWNPADPDERPHILYVSFPSLKDPHHDPGEKQRQTGECVTFVPWDLFSQWQETRRLQRPEDYKALKQEIEERILDELRRRIPDVMDKLVFSELSSPLTAQHFCNASKGAIYGLQASPQRFTNPHLRSRTPIKNFYMTGVDIASLGVVGGMTSGVLTAATIDPRVYRKLL